MWHSALWGRHCPSASVVLASELSFLRVAPSSVCFPPWIFDISTLPLPALLGVQARSRRTWPLWARWAGRSQLLMRVSHITDRCCAHANMHNRPTKQVPIRVVQGLTFDSGGYNLKSGAGSMIEMMKARRATVQALPLHWLLGRGSCLINPTAGWGGLPTVPSLFPPPPQTLSVCSLTWAAAGRPWAQPRSSRC